MFAQAYCPHKELQKKTGEEQVEYCKEKTGKDWHKVDDMYKYGTFVKKELYEKEIEAHPEITTSIGEEIETVTRSRLCTYSHKLTSYTESAVKQIMGQYK